MIQYKSIPDTPFLALLQRQDGVHFVGAVDRFIHDIIDRYVDVFVPVYTRDVKVSPEFTGRYVCIGISPMSHGAICRSFVGYVYDVPLETRSDLSLPYGIATQERIGIDYVCDGARFLVSTPHGELWIIGEDDKE